MRKLKTIYRNCCIIFCLSVACSCQKVIQVHLNDSAPKNVIEGNITDQPGPYLVTLSRSVNFDQDNVFPAVSGALVVITDKNTGFADTLAEATPGHYKTNTITGIPGHSYQLYVKAGSNIYTATSAMPQLVTLDSLYSEKSAARGNPTLVPVYTDPVAKGNYYHFTEYVNDSVNTSIMIRNDKLVNGQVMTEALNGRDGGRLEAGAYVVLYLECIDSSVYQYFYTLQQTKNSNSATPANPITNIAGGALGYFSAHTSSVKSITVPF